MKELKERIQTYLRGLAEHVAKRRGADLLNQAVQEIDRLEESEHTALVIIANVQGGNWDLAPAEWRAAAERWRDEYHKRLPSAPDAIEEPAQ